MRPEPTLVEHLVASHLIDKLLALLANMKSGSSLFDEVLVIARFFQASLTARADQGGAPCGFH